jgi:hypothetical protein
MYLIYVTVDGNHDVFRSHDPLDGDWHSFLGREQATSKMIWEPVQILRGKMPDYAFFLLH